MNVAQKAVSMVDLCAFWCIFVIKLLWLADPETHELTVSIFQNVLYLHIGREHLFVQSILILPFHTKLSVTVAEPLHLFWP